MYSLAESVVHQSSKPGEGNGTPLQYSCLENPMDGGAWQAAVHGVAKSRTRLNGFTFTFHFHALEKEMATHSSVLPGESQGRGAWWAAVYGVAQSRTRLKRLSSSSSSPPSQKLGCQSRPFPLPHPHPFQTHTEMTTKYYPFCVLSVPLLYSPHFSATALV